MSRTNLGIPTDRELPGFHDAAHQLLIGGINDLYEQITPGLNDEDRLKQLDALATLAIKLGPDLTEIEAGRLRTKLTELYDELVVPVPPEPTHWEIEVQLHLVTPTRQAMDHYPTYAEAHRVLRDRLRADRSLSPARHRIVPVYPVIGA